jgi:peptidoglycan/LPS O-acetylase OafA/YrhL
MTERRHDLDWLRVGATLLLIPFHVAKVFDVPPYYHVKNAELSEALGLFTGFVHLFHMPLFFVLAGWAARASMDRRRDASFVRERLRRLLLPLVAVSALVLPLVGWIDQRSIHGSTETLGAYLPTFFTDIERFTWSHLWFLAYLLTFTLVFLPGLRRWRDAEPRPVPTSVLVTYVVVLGLVQGSLRGRWPGFQNLYDDWANVCWYGLLFLGGFAIAHHDDLDARLRRRATPYLGAGLAAAAAIGGLSSIDAPWTWWPTWMLSAVAAVGIVGGLIGLAPRVLAGGGGALEYWRPAAFPLYLIHQPVIVVLAFVVVGRPWSIGVKLVVLLAAASATTLLAYDVGARAMAELRGPSPPPDQRNRGSAMRASLSRRWSRSSYPIWRKRSARLS